MCAISLTFDVEPDIHTNTYEGVIKGIFQVITILDKYKVKATFFTTCDCMEKFPKLFQGLKNQGHEIASHGYRHLRFDELNSLEKQEQIKKTLRCFKKYLKITPKGFRAPQHSIDDKTLKLLKQNSFLYDSSLTPFNFLQLIFFPKKFFSCAKGFFTSRRKHRILDEFYEIPTSSFLIPFVSLPLRVLPWKILKIYLWVLRKNYSHLVFYAHSWDFIELPKSKIDRLFGYEKLVQNLEKTIIYFLGKRKFVKMEELT